jgi:hypothetical protein
VDPKIRNESNDDVREIKTRDEIAREADLADSLRLPTSSERRARRVLRVQDFAQNVLKFESSIAGLSNFRPNGKYSIQTIKKVQKQSKEVGHNVQRLLGFLDLSKPEAGIQLDLPADTIEEKTGLLCLLAARLDPKLKELLTFERQNLSNATLRNDIASQLRQIAALSKQISH